MFICNHCPYVKAVLPRILRDCRELAGLGIGAVAIMSNDPTDYPEDSFDNMRRIATEMDFPFPYLLDASQAVAKAYGAVCTPDFFGFDAGLGLQYRGRLDASGKAPPPPTPAASSSRRCVRSPPAATARPRRPASAARSNGGRHHEQRPTPGASPQPHRPGA
jgi:hypothetical protein